MAKSSVKASGGTPALRVLADAGIPHQVHTFDGGNDHFGDVAVEAIGADAEQVFKTLVVDLNAGKGPRPRLAVCVLPVSYQLSLKKAAAAFGAAKATMAKPEDAAKSSGYIPGGISPLGQKTQLPTAIDETALLWDEIYFSGGKRGLDIQMSPEALAPLIDATFVDLLAN